MKKSQINNTNCTPAGMSVALLENQLLSYELYNQQSIALLFPADSITRPQQVYFKDYYNVSDRKITGVTVVSAATLPVIYINGEEYETFQLSAFATFTISFFCSVKNRLIFDRFPMSALLNPNINIGNNMKFPAYKTEMYLDFKKSFVQINSITEIDPIVNYALVLNMTFE